MTTPNHIYYDIIIPNKIPDLSTLPNNNYSYQTQQLTFETLPPDNQNGLQEIDLMGEKVVQAYYNDTLTQPVVDSADDYSLSIVRFSIPLSSVPLMIWPNTLNDPKSPLPSTQKNFYSVCLAYEPSPQVSYKAHQWLQWVPDFQNANPYEETYYYVRSVQKLVDLLNTALYQAYYNVYQQIIAGGPYPLTMPLTPPFVQFDPQTQLFTLYAEEGYNRRGGVDTINIYMNNDLYNLFLLPKESYNINKDYTITQITQAPPPFVYRTQHYGRNVLLDVRNLGNNSQLLTSAFSLPVYKITNINNQVVDSSYSITQGKLLYKMTQEHETVYKLYSAKSIGFLSYNLPVLPNYVRNTSKRTVGNSSNVQTFLTDIDIPAESLKDTNAVLYYQPSGEYRYIDLTSNRPINVIDLKIVWIDKEGDYHDIFLYANECITVKLLFKRRGVMIDK